VTRVIFFFKEKKVAFLNPLSLITRRELISVGSPLFGSVIVNFIINNFLSVFIIYLSANFLKMTDVQEPEEISM
jgi:hypothetical protein